MNLSTLKPSLRNNEPQQEFIPQAAPTSTPPVAPDPPGPEQPPQPLPQGDPPPQEIPQADPPPGIEAAQPARHLTLSAQEARAASPVDLAVAGEEDAGVGLELLLRRPDGGQQPP